ncbi:hypothetical protein KR018_008069, partial [Drosophila ironensis]
KRRTGILPTGVLPIIITRKYILHRKIGSGSFSDIYLANNRETGAEVAIKLEPEDFGPSMLSDENRLYKELSGAVGFPEVYEYICESDYDNYCYYRMLVMQLLGPSLEDMFNYCNRRFSLKTVLMLSIQMFERLELLHSRGLLHRDLRPENFLMGVEEFKNRLYLIDLGLGEIFWSKLNNSHVPFSRGKRVRGNYGYSSVNTFKCYGSSRRDDMESLGYIFIYFLSGSLPWMDVKANTRANLTEIITELKASTRISDLCKDYPIEFSSYLTYCRTLGFEEEPHYQFLIRFFSDLMHSQRIANDFRFDWVMRQEKEQQ